MHSSLLPPPLRPQQVEHWRDVVIDGSRLRYRVSDMGRVVSLVSGERRPIKPVLTPEGYLKVSLCHGSRVIHRKVHRLVMAAFDGPSRLQVDHVNAIKTDNRLANLQYVTSQENNRRAISKGLVGAGERCRFTKLTEDMVFQIRWLHQQGWNAWEIAHHYPVNSKCVTDIVTRTTWQLSPQPPGYVPPDTIPTVKPSRGSRNIDCRVAAEIKRLLATGLRQIEVAKRCGVHACTVSSIKSGKTWTDPRALQPSPVQEHP